MKQETHKQEGWLKQSQVRLWITFKKYQVGPLMITQNNCIFNVALYGIF